LSLAIHSHTETGTRHDSRQPAPRTRRLSPLAKGLLFTAPWILGFVAFTVYPFLSTIYYSFTSFSGVGSPKFIGLGNYRQLVHDPLFWSSLWNTVFYTIIEVPLSTVIAIAIALLLSMNIRGRAVYRTMVYIPTLVPVVAGSIIWLWLFNPSFGVVNDLLSQLHLPAPGWMFSVTLAKPTIILLGLWGIGAPVVIYLAALQGVPRMLYEAAAIEGAGPWQRLRHVTLPMISPAILFNIVLALVVALQYFTQAYVMTNGGPDNATLFYVLYLYEQAFKYLNLGYASAMAWMLFVVVLLFTLVLFHGSKRWVFYAEDL
jgi:multiple sugar transport system permease protein